MDQRQGQVVLDSFDTVKNADPGHKLFMHQSGDVKVDRDLVIELIPKSGTPLLGAIEVIRQQSVSGKVAAASN